MKDKFKKGIIKLVIAVSLGVGPIIVTSQAHPKGNIYILIIGAVCMISSVLLGFLGIKEIMSGFFDKTSE